MSIPTTNSQFEKLRQAAQYFTMTAAVLGGLTYLAVLARPKSNALLTTQPIFIGATICGGVIMGVLYIVFLVQRR